MAKEEINIYLKLLKSNIILTYEQTKFLCENAVKILKEEPNIVKINLPITICGNIFGHFYDLLEIFKIGGSIPETNYLFLGNYINEGCFSLEVLTLLLCFKVL